MAFFLPAFAYANTSFNINSAELAELKHLWQQAKNGQISKARLSKLQDPTMRSLLTWRALKEGKHDFATISKFITVHPDWPDLDKLKSKAEYAIDDKTTDSELLRWFKHHSPVTSRGKRIYAEKQLEHCLVHHEGKPSSCSSMVKQIWQEVEFSAKQEQEFRSKYSKILTTQDDQARLRHFIWQENWAEVKRLLPRVNRNLQQVYRLCIGLAESGKFDRKLYELIPNQYRGQPELVYWLLRHYVKANNLVQHQDYVLKVLSHPLPQPNKWWKYRHIIVRDLLQQKNFRGAYQIASNHGIIKGSDYAEAEWLSGWIALRFLHQPAAAHKHFSNFLAKVHTGMSRSRGHYWLAMAEQELKNPQAALHQYKQAARYSDLFYGQLAHLKLKQYAITLPKTATYTEQDLAYFRRNSISKAAYLLLKLKETGTAERFIKEAVRKAPTRGQKYLNIHMAQQSKHTKIAVEAAKISAQYGEVFPEFSHPMLGFKENKGELSPLIHALIRQESCFDPAARSSAGALGLMQLLPSTAKDVAKQIKVPFRQQNLTTDYKYNVKLGTRYVSNLLERFEGSYILTIASYNAGPTPINRWLDKFGDLRKEHSLDKIVDWVELIPYGETRNYVQRVIENLQVYRYRYDPANYKLEYLLKDLGAQSKG